MIQRLISIILTIIVALATIAGTITGRVLDENQVPMPYANVVLMNRVDSAFVQGTVTGEDGIFSLTTDCDDCLLKISSVGYVTRWVETNGASAGDIVMQPDAALLGEVVVEGERPAHKLGRE